MRDSVEPLAKALPLFVLPMPPWRPTEVAMFVLQSRVHSLADLLEMRAMLRRQETLVGTALADVQFEIKSWHRHRRAAELVREPMPRDLCVLWEELESRERELALDVLQIRAALSEANAEIQQKLHRSTKRAS